MNYQKAAELLSNGMFSDVNPDLMPCNDFSQAFIFQEEVFYNYSNELIIWIPKGFYTDGISSPGKFNNAWYGIQKHGPYAMAGYLHDRLYFSPFAYDIKIGAEIRLTRKQCDQIFRHACDHLDCPAFRRNIATVCLYACGWAPYLAHRLKELLDLSQAWDPDRTELLWYRHTKYSQRLVKTRVKDLEAS